MNGYRTSRVLVIDDVATEGIQAIQALASLGIGAIYHDTVNGNCTEKHKGIRLLMLDMILQNRGGTGSDPKSDMSILMGALDEIIEPGHDTLTVVCWTSHPDMASTLEAAFSVQFPDAKLAAVIVADKADLADPAKVNELAVKIRTSLIDQGPSSLLLNWEQVVHDSASATTGSIFELAKELQAADPNKPPALYKIAASLALAERGSRLHSEGGADCARAFSNSLVPLLADRIEHFDCPEAALTEEVMSNFKKFLNSSGNSRIHKSKINSKINLSYTESQGDASPGNAYIFTLTEGLDSALEATLSKAIHDLFIDDSLKKSDVSKATLLIEISPLCDFSQAKLKLNRFIVGALVLASDKNQSREGDFLRKIGPLRVSCHDVPDEDYFLILNCHFIVTLPKESASKLRFGFRLRNQVLVDTISWSSAQLSRPGFIYTQ